MAKNTDDDGNNKAERWKTYKKQVEGTAHRIQRKTDTDPLRPVLDPWL